MVTRRRHHARRDGARLASKEKRSKDVMAIGDLSFPFNRLHASACQRCQGSLLEGRHQVKVMKVAGHAGNLRTRGAVLLYSSR